MGTDRLEKWAVHNGNTNYNQEQLPFVDHAVLLCTLCNSSLIYAQYIGIYIYVYIYIRIYIYMHSI